MLNDFCSSKDVRRQDRLLDEERALEILQNEEYGVLSMVEVKTDESETFAGYGIPINFVWDKNKYIYFHCAPEGHKLECIDKNPNVSFCIIGKTNVIPNKFTTAYESIIIRGKITHGLSDFEKMNALILILEKYSPEDIETGKKYAEKSFFRTEILRLEIESVSGKTKKVKP